MDCELSLIEDDKYLVPLLRASNKEELEFLVDLITDKISEELTSTEKFLKYSPDHTKYCDEISSEIQYFAGNTIFNLLTGEGVPYERIAAKVAKRFKIKNYNELSIEQIESKIIEKVLETAFDKADEKTKKAMVDSLGEYKGDFKDYAKYSKQAFMSSLQIAIRIGGFKSYQLAMIVANGLVKQIMGRGLALAANAGLARAISVFAGPIGWAISAIWALFDIAGPAYRVIIPAVIYIAYLRLKFKNQRRGFILVGKSGHGKSSLINCLAGVDIAKVTHAKPTTPKTKVYNIDSFNGKYPLRIIDTRGIFESTKPNHRVSDDALQVLKNSMIRENPAVVMHIMSAKEVRAMSEDQKIFKELIEDIKITMNNHPKCIFVITKAGDLINPRNFPTKEHFTKIKEIMDYFCRDVLKVKTQPISATKPENGYIIISKNSSYQAVIPVKCLSLEKNWNINTLSSFLEKTVDKLNLHNCK